MFTEEDLKICKSMYEDDRRASLYHVWKLMHEEMQGNGRCANKEIHATEEDATQCISDAQQFLTNLEVRVPVHACKSPRLASPNRPPTMFGPK